MRTDHFVDLTGKRFGRLVVVRRAPKELRRSPKWECVCDCGSTAVIRGGDLKRNDGRGARSCGCNRTGRVVTHGLCREFRREHQTWVRMRGRCSNPRAKEWKNYGGRGIKVCERWTGVDGFQNFLADMGPRPGAGFSIDRIDNSGDYSPRNCRWATSAEQSRNTRRNVSLEYDGRRMTYADLSEICGVGAKLIRTRMVEYGWTVHEAMWTQPATHGRNKKGPPRGCSRQAR